MKKRTNISTSTRNVCQWHASSVRVRHVVGHSQAQLVWRSLLVPITTRRLHWREFRRHDFLTCNDNTQRMNAAPNTTSQVNKCNEQTWMCKLTWYLVIRSCFICSNLRLSSFWRSPFFCARPTYTCLPLSSLPFMSSTACREVSHFLAGESGR